MVLRATRNRQLVVPRVGLHVVQLVMLVVLLNE